MNIETGAGSFLENLMHSRHVIWWEVLDYFSQQSFFTRLFGIDLFTESMHNARHMRSHSLYIQQIYATGYLGCMLFSILIGQAIDRLRNNKFVNLFQETVVLGIIFLGVGISAESFFFTQVSWFPFLFLGGFISETNTRKVK